MGPINRGQKELLSSSEQLCLFTQRPHLANYGGKMIQVYGPQLWNSLPKEIHDSTSLDTFKNKIKSYYVAQYDL